MKKNIAVVGCGHWGKNLVRNFFELGSLAAVCDPNDKLAERYAKEYDVKNLDFFAILTDSTIEGVVLAVPAPLHASMAIEAMSSGKHVFVEKPLAMNEAEAQLMISCSEENGVQLMVGHLLHYHPVFIKLKEIVQSGKIGDINYIYSNRLSFGKVRAEEDVVWSFAPHDISMILSITDEEPCSVRTESSNALKKNISDIATLHMEFQSGIKAHIFVSWLHPYKEQKLVVIGKNGILVFDDTNVWKNKLTFYNHNIDISKPALDIKQSEVEYFDISESEPLRNECKHFIDVVSGFQSPKTDGQEGVRVLSVLSSATSKK